MTAYELSEKLNAAVNKNEKHLTLDIQAMLMLRQQADRIAELEKVLKPIKCIVKDCQNHKHEGGFTGDLCNPCYEFITTGKGVYSQAYRNTQTKPLSDEEIIKIRQATKAKSTENWADTLAFARAIEERHGIK